MVDITSQCKASRHGTDDADLSALPKTECSSIPPPDAMNLDQCKATIFANGADLLTISVSFDGGITYKELSHHNDYKLTAHHLIENIDTNTIIILEVETSDTEGGLLADLHLKNLKNGEVDRIYTSQNTDGIAVQNGGENMIERTQFNVNNKHFNKNAQWIWDDAQSEVLKFVIDFGEKQNVQRLITAGYDRWDCV